MFCRAIELVLWAEKVGSYIYNVADDGPLEADEILLLLTGSHGRASEALSEQEKWEGIMDSMRIREELGFRPSSPSLRDAISECALWILGARRIPKLASRRERIESRQLSSKSAIRCLFPKRDESGLNSWRNRKISSIELDRRALFLGVLRAEGRPRH
jgi:hypothetical protein